MLHELHAIMMGDPREALLAELAKAEAPIPEALSRLAAFHVGHKEKFLPLREKLLSSPEHHFPHAKDVPALVLFFGEQLHRLWASCQSPQDDLFVAAFGFFGITAIHPFEAGNGRVAVDFSQFLLMRRWQLLQLPMDLPADAGRMAMGVWVSLLPPCDGDSPASYYRARTELSAFFEQTTLQRLKQSKPFQIMTQWMSEALHPEAMPSTPREA
ncbi:MAG: Fic family protein [Myxococcales bacterium]|nr:Fic family protein [Myxococcales bacterium]